MFQLVGAIEKIEYDVVKFLITHFNYFLLFMLISSTHHVKVPFNCDKS